MTNEALEAVMDRWLQDNAFREAMRRDPEGAVRAAGIPISEGDLAVLHSIDWTLSDEELQQRVSRGRRWP